VSGYAKRMMEEAEQWLPHNPDPDAVLVHPPPRRLSVATLLKDVVTVDDLRGAVDARAKKMIDKNPAVAASPEMVAARQALEEYIDGERDFERKRGGWVNGLMVPFQGRLDDEHVEVIGHWLVRWAHDGRNVFDLSADFVAAMLLTDPAGLDLASIRLPFRGVLVLIPDRFVTDAKGAHFTKIHVCETFESAKSIVDGEMVLVEKPAGRLLSIRATATGGEWLLATVDADALARDGVMALTGLDTYNLDEDGDKQALDSLRRIVLGMLVYLCAVERSMVRRDTNGKRVAKAGPSLTHWDVARTVRIDPRLLQAARAGSREVALRLKHRHIVRGHYRNQPIGEGRKERKTIWIAPFWKGPEDGAAIVHTYKPAPPESP
jgi:hypothetical protein